MNNNLEFGIPLEETTTTTTTSEDNDDEPHFMSKPPKILRTEGNLDEDEEKQHQLRCDLFKLLKKFFRCAFTIIIKRRELCPTDGFRVDTLWGIQVPEFIHPATVEYVEEVSKKLILFMHRNSTEGCAVHIMIEKNKTLHVVQRFVFRLLGSLDFQEKVGKHSIDMDFVKSHCKDSLLQLLNSDAIKPMSAPQYSRWSISIGFKEEFIDGENFDELWMNDPSGHYFPWKKKLRNMANTNGKDNNAVKPKPRCSTSLFSSSSLESTADCNGTTVQVALVEDAKQLTGNEVESTKTSEACTSSRTPYNESSKIVCTPFSSFPITSSSSLILSIYMLCYPAPVNNFVFSPRPIRNLPSVSLRLSQFRNRLRQSSNKFQPNTT